MGDRILAVDIGSTNVHCGLVDPRSLLCLRRSDFPPALTGVRLPAFIDAIRGDITAAVAGGGGAAAGRAVGIFKSMKAAPVIRLRWHRHLPVRFLYEKPETLGADRIADALYAHARCPARNVIVIDSGTAITVDAVSSPGTYTGGVILAGVAAQLAGLRASAGTLPAVPMPAGKVPLPGRSTVRCMQAGAAHGTAGALNHLVKEYRRLMGGKCVVLATGGAWHLTQKLVDFDSTEVPDMTLIGMGIYTLYPNKSP